MTDLGLGAPAERALAQAGFADCGDVRATPREVLAGLHGVGPKALAILQRECPGADTVPEP